MSVNEIFKTEFRGYSKKEVAEYIVTLNSQMESLKNELDRCESELEKYRAELDETEKQTPEIDIENIKQELRAQLEAEIKESLESEYEERLAKIQEAQDETVSVDKEELATLREKAEQYDDQKDILAELMIKVKADATEIYSEAETKSRELMMDAFDKFTKLQGDFDVMKKNVEASKADIDARMTNIRRALDDFTQYLDFMGQDITNTAENFKQNM